MTLCELDSYEWDDCWLWCVVPTVTTRRTGPGRMSVITPRLGNSDEKLTIRLQWSVLTPDQDSYNLTSGFRGSGESRKSFLDSNENLRSIDRYWPVDNLTSLSFTISLSLLYSILHFLSEFGLENNCERILLVVLLYKHKYRFHNEFAFTLMKV